MDNIRGSALMVLAMAGFALEDTFIKFVSADLPVGQILFMMGIGGAVIFGAISVLKGDRFVSRDFLVTPVLLRNLGEMIAAFGYITALTLIPLSTVAAIIQATPLCVTLGAALFMGEQVGWRRWSAIVVGFFAFVILSSLFLVLAAVVSIRLWWLRRKMARDPAFRTAGGDRRAGARQAIEGEYHVVVEERTDSQG